MDILYQVKQRLLYDGALPGSGDSEKNFAASAVVGLSSLSAKVSLSLQAAGSLEGLHSWPLGDQAGAGACPVVGGGDGPA